MVLQPRELLVQGQQAPLNLEPILNVFPFPSHIRTWLPSLQIQFLCSFPPWIFPILSDLMGKERMLKEGTSFCESLSVCKDLLGILYKGVRIVLCP